jgi:hypothetical protein
MIRRITAIAMVVAVSACQPPPPPASSEAAPQGAVAEPATAADAPERDPASPPGADAPGPPPAAEGDRAADAAAPPRQAHGHHHAAPRGGTLVELGDEFAHLELLFDPASGRLAVYVLDGEAERAVRVAHESLRLRLDATAADADAESLAAVAGVLTGETVGDTSRFEAVIPALAGRTRFEGVIDTITVRGRTFRDVAIAVP